MRPGLPLMSTGLVAAVLFGSVAFSGCASSGVMGKVLVGPPCPAPALVQPCDKPYETTLQIRKATGGSVLAKVHSGRDGEFRVRLSSGRYVIEPLRGEAHPSVSPQPVTVVRSKYSKVTIRFVAHR